jgi:hypothetical protein
MWVYWFLIQNKVGDYYIISSTNATLYDKTKILYLQK